MSNFELLFSTKIQDQQTKNNNTKNHFYFKQNDTLENNKLNKLVKRLHKNFPSIFTVLKNIHFTSLFEILVIFNLYDNAIYK